MSSNHQSRGGGGRGFGRGGGRYHNHPPGGRVGGRGFRPSYRGGGSGRGFGPPFRGEGSGTPFGGHGCGPSFRDEGRGRGFGPPFRGDDCVTPPFGGGCYRAQCRGGRGNNIRYLPYDNFNHTKNNPPSHRHRRKNKNDKGKKESEKLQSELQEAGLLSRSYLNVEVKVKVDPNLVDSVSKDYAGNILNGKVTRIMKFCCKIVFKVTFLTINRICFVTHDVLKEIMRLNFVHDDDFDLPIVNRLLLSKDDVKDSNLIRSLVVAPNDANDERYDYMSFNNHSPILSSNKYVTCRCCNQNFQPDSLVNAAKIKQPMNIMNFLFATVNGASGIISKNEDALMSDDFSNFDSEGDLEERFDACWTDDGTYGWKRGFIPAEIVELTNKVTIKRIQNDAFFGDPTFQDDLTYEVFRSSKIFPLKDSFASINSYEEVELLEKDTKFNPKSEGGASPDEYNDWGDKTTDANLSRFFFHGLGATLLEQQFVESSQPDLGPIEIDMDFMKGLQMRKGFRPMGVKVYFDADQKATGIYDSAKEIMFKPGDDGWEGAKYLARSSALTLLTAREHLLQAHLLVSNYFSLASIKHLPPSHPIRRLINVFTFRTNRVNNEAFDALTPNMGLLHRNVGFEYKSLMSVFDNAFQNSNAWEPFPKRNMRPELLEMSANGKLPYHSEGVEYHNIVENFVKEWLNESGYAASDRYAEAFYNEVRESTLGQKYELPEFAGADSIAQVLTQAIFMVTCYHEIIGTVIDYTNDYKCAGFRVREDGSDGSPVTETDAQCYMLQLSIVASTALNVPMLMKQYQNYFGLDGAPSWEREKWDDFIEALEEQSEKVQESDKKKDVPFLFFDPKKFESAISV